MAFLGNRTVNLLNLHYGLHALAMALGGVFFGVYLLKAGLSVPAVMVAMAAILFGRFAVRPLVLPLGKRIGLKGVLVVGSLFASLQYLLLAKVEGVGPMLYLTLAVSSLGETLYWTGYHAYFAKVGDAEHRGSHISAREALVQGVGIAGPVVGGWILTTLGPLWAFGFAALAQGASALPLLGTPAVEVPREVEGGREAARAGVMFFLAEGFIASGFYWAWQLALSSAWAAASRPSAAPWPWPRWPGRSWACSMVAGSTAAMATPPSPWPSAAWPGPSSCAPLPPCPARPWRCSWSPTPWGPSSPGSTRPA